MGREQVPPIILNPVPRLSDTRLADSSKSWMVWRGYGVLRASGWLLHPCPGAWMPAKVTNRQFILGGTWSQYIRHCVPIQNVLPRSNRVSAFYGAYVAQREYTQDSNDSKFCSPGARVLKYCSAPEQMNVTGPEPLKDVRSPKVFIVYQSSSLGKCRERNRKEMQRWAHRHSSRMNYVVRSSLVARA